MTRRIVMTEEHELPGVRDGDAALGRSFREAMQKAVDRAAVASVGSTHGTMKAFIDAAFRRREAEFLKLLDDTLGEMLRSPSFCGTLRKSLQDRALVALADAGGAELLRAMSRLRADPELRRRVEDAVAMLMGPAGAAERGAGGVH